MPQPLDLAWEMRRKVFSKTLPDELWLQIFSYLSIVHTVNQMDEFLDPFEQRYSREKLAENFTTKCAITLVNSQFYILSRSLMFEILSFKKPRHIHTVVKRMRKSSELERTIQQWTKRLELNFTEPPNLQSLDPLDFAPQITGHISSHHTKRTQRAHVEINILLRTCRNLRHFVCCMPLETDRSDWLYFKDGLGTNGSGLRYFSWRYAPLIPLRLCLPLIKNLHTLDLTVTAMVKTDDGIEMPEIPLLHTIRGPLNIVCPIFAKTHLPALRTLLTCRHRAKVPGSLGVFFDKHGPKLKSLALDYTCDVPDLPPLATCPNLQDLVVDWGHLSSMEYRLPSLVRLGLAFNPDKGLPPILFILHNLETFETHLENFPNLRTVQIVDSRVSRHLVGNGPNALRLRQRRLRGRGIELRNEEGRILLG